jgi:hypothetical protein
MATIVPLRAQVPIKAPTASRMPIGADARRDPIDHRPADSLPGQTVLESEAGGNERAEDEGDLIRPVGSFVAKEIVGKRQQADEHADGDQGLQDRRLFTPG